MNWKRIAIYVLATLGTSGELFADEATDSPVFKDWVVGRTTFTVSSGRVSGNFRDGMGMFGQHQATTDGPVREQVTFTGNGVSATIAYSFIRKGSAGAPQEELGVECGSEGRFVLRYAEKDHPDQFFHFVQEPGQPARLSLPPREKPITLTAPTLWHLLIIDPEACRRKFLPMMEAIRPGWHLGFMAQGAEDELVKMSAAARKSDRKQWEVWVDQLGDPLCTKRDRADRNLREVGAVLLGYLNRLDMGRLDAEQRARIRRIIRWLSTQAGEDTSERVAAMLMEDPRIWLALLSRPEEPTRRAAVQQLTVLLDKPITIDPKAPPDSQAKAREELRLQIDKLGANGVKPGDAAKPAEDAAKPANGGTPGSAPR